MVHGDRSSVGWTLILWDIGDLHTWSTQSYTQVSTPRLKRFSCAENVPVPDQLRTPAGIKQVKTVLRDKFAKSRELQLHCIKLACRWPDHRSPYADLLGWLTTLGDVEALGYQWQGQKDKSHNADRLLKQVSKLHLTASLESSL